MGDLDGRHVGWRHNHPHSQPSRAEQVCGEVVGHPDAAMRRRMSWQRSTVECNARPSDALHVRHVGIVIQVRVVLGFFLDDAEDPGRRLASLLAARHGRTQDRAVGVIDSDPLVAQRNDGHNRCARDARLDGCRRALVPTACGARMIAHRNHSGPARNGKTCRLQPSRLVLWVYKTRGHARHIRSATPFTRRETPTPCDPSCQVQFLP